MSFLEKLYNVLNARMVEPTSYGWFHFMFVTIMILVTILLCVFARNVKDKNFRIILAVIWIVMVVLEIYKEIVYSWSYVDGKSVWDYQWYIFPFQLCSTPLYVLPFVIFKKDGLIKDASIAFLMTFSFFGGLVTFIYPEQVFTTRIGINLQTMIHHGLQIVLGVYIAAYYRKKLNIKFFLKGVIMFMGLIALAFTLNILAPTFTTENFNMFYIGPKFPCILLILSMLYPVMPYPLFLLMYIFGFTLVALIFYYIFYGFTRIGGKKVNEK